MSVAEKLMALVGAHGVDWSCVDSGGVSYTTEEIVNGCAGMNYAPFIAALYSLAGDDSVKSDVRAWLSWALVRDQLKHGWNPRVKTESGKSVCMNDRLIDLFLLEERQPVIVRAVPVIRLAFCEVSEQTWSKRLSHQYAAVFAEFHRALADAVEHIERNMRKESPH